MNFELLSFGCFDFKNEHSEKFKKFLSFLVRQNKSKAF